MLKTLLLKSCKTLFYCKTQIQASKTLIFLTVYIYKGLNLFSFFLKNVKDFKPNYYVQHRNSKMTKYLSKDTILQGMVNLVWVFWGPDDQIFSLRVLLRFVVWGSVIFGGFDTNWNFFFPKKDSNSLILFIEKKSKKLLVSRYATRATHAKWELELKYRNEYFIKPQQNIYI